MSTPILAARELGARSGEHVLLDAVDLEVRPGRVVAVIGKSGSGKTTLGLALQGEHGPNVALSGSVRLHGDELLGLTDAQRRAARATTTAYLPQHPAAVLNPTRRIGKVLGELAALRPAGEGHPNRRHQDRAARATAVDEALRAAQLRPDPRLLRRYPHQLSGGQQQRVALAQALITRPDIVVLDEPTTGLDTTTKAETADMLADLAADGTALVLLTHDLALARQLADDVIVLRDGRVVEHGPGTGPLRAPAHEHTREILAAEPRLPESGDTGFSPHREESVLLRAEGVGRKSKNGTTVLADVDLDIGHGRCVAIVGRSGAGKTTLGRCLAGLTRPNTGKIILNGVPLPATIQRRDREQRRQVQYVHQDARASFDEYRPVLDQIARTPQLLLGLSPDEARRGAITMLETLGLSGQQTHRRPSGLSGGQLQRAALARALLARPAVLICDEITSALDVVNQADLLDALAVVKSTMDTSVVLISHDFAAIGALADEVHVLEDGHHVESAPLTHLFAHPKSPAAAALVAAARRLPDRRFRVSREFRAELDRERVRRRTSAGRSSYDVAPLPPKPSTAVDNSRGCG